MAFCQGSIGPGSVVVSEKGAHCPQGQPRASRHTREVSGVSWSAMCVSGAVWQDGTGHAALGRACARNPGYQVVYLSPALRREA